MITKFKIALICSVLFNLTSLDAMAKEKRGDDFVVYFSRVLRFPENEGLWAVISNNVAPTLTKVPFEICPTGVMAFPCIYQNDEIKILNKKKSNQRWVFLSRNMPDYIVNADVNGDGKDELVAKYYNDTFLISNIHTGSPRWTKLLTVGREAEVADLNGNGKADLITWDTTPGLQVSMDNGRWVKLTREPVGGFWTFNLDGKFRDDLVATLTTKQGLYIKRKNQAWLKIHTRTPITIWRADTDGDGRDNIVANFGAGLGTYVWLANGKWAKISTASPNHVQAADLNGNGKDDLVFYTNLNTVTVRMDNGKWVSLWKGLTRILAAGDIDGNGKDDLIFSRLDSSTINATSTWAWMNNSKWAELASGEALSIFGAQIKACDIFSGICAWVAAPGFSRYTYTFANLDGR